MFSGEIPDTRISHDCEVPELTPTRTVGHETGEPPSNNYRQFGDQLRMITIENIAQSDDKELEEASQYLLDGVEIV